jgi:hypothetical protein
MTAPEESREVIDTVDGMDTTAAPDWDADAAPAPNVGAAQPKAEDEQLLEHDDRGPLSSRWMDIQAEFVDEPRRAIEDADALVTDLMNRVTESFSAQRAALEKQWADGEVSTEQMRQSLQRYRTFFNRLLAV